MIKKNNYTINSKYSFVIIVLILGTQSCVIGDHRPRWVYVNPIIENGILLFDELHKTIASDRRFKRDNYNFFSISLKEFNPKKRHRRTLWLLAHQLENVYESISKLPELPNQIYYGDKVPNLATIIKPSNISISPNLEYEFVISVIGSDYDQKNKVTFWIRSRIMFDKSFEVEPHQSKKP